MEISGTQAEWIRLCFGSSLSSLLRPKVRSDVGSGRRGWAAEPPAPALLSCATLESSIRGPAQSRGGEQPAGRRSGQKRADPEGGLWRRGASGKKLLLAICRPEQIATVVAPLDPEGAAGAAAGWGWGSAAMQKGRQHSAALPGWLSSARDLHACRLPLPA